MKGVRIYQRQSTRQPVRVAALLLGLALSVGALGVAPDGSTQRRVVLSPDAQQIAHGREVYLASFCGTCHASSAAQTGGLFGPIHDHLTATVLQRFRSGAYRGKAKTVSAYLRESILQPDAYEDPAYAGSRYRMPAFTDMSEADLDDLIAFLEQP